MQRQELALDAKGSGDSSNSSADRIKNEVIQSHKNRIQQLKLKGVLPEARKTKNLFTFTQNVSQQAPFSKASNTAYKSYRTPRISEFNDPLPPEMLIKDTSQNFLA